MVALGTSLSVCLGKDVFPSSPFGASQPTPKWGPQERGGESLTSKERKGWGIKKHSHEADNV